MARKRRRLKGTEKGFQTAHENAKDDCRNQYKGVLQQVCLASVAGVIDEVRHSGVSPSGAEAFAYLECDEKSKKTHQSACKAGVRIARARLFQLPAGLAGRNL